MIFVRNKRIVVADSGQVTSAQRKDSILYNNFSTFHLQCSWYDEPSMLGKSQLFEERRNESDSVDR